MGKDGKRAKRSGNENPLKNPRSKSTPSSRRKMLPRQGNLLESTAKSIAIKNKLQPISAPPARILFFVFFGLLKRRKTRFAKKWGTPRLFS